jgi:hypothetical protein
MVEPEFECFSFAMNFFYFGGDKRKIKCKGYKNLFSFEEKLPKLAYFGENKFEVGSKT